MCRTSRRPSPSCHQLGIPFEELVPAVRRLEAVPHRMQLIRGGGNYTVIDDAYNSNPKGAEAALRTLDHVPGAADPGDAGHGGAGGKGI